jgi:hypothetical protein
MRHSSLFRWPVGLFGLLLAVAAAMGASSWLTADDSERPATTPVQKSQLRREGTELREEPGRFLAVGNRQTFVSAAGTSYIALENLNLERVGKIVAASPDAVDWFITGTVTEYHGANYLLITRARRKASTSKMPRGF